VKSRVAQKYKTTVNSRKTRDGREGYRCCCDKLKKDIWTILQRLVREVVGRGRMVLHDNNDTKDISCPVNRIQLYKIFVGNSYEECLYILLMYILLRS
jgi:hypothetical protein